MIDLLAQNPVGPMGADFGKASPIGLLVIVLLLVSYVPVLPTFLPALLK